MNENWYSRTKLLIGTEGFDTLAHTSVAIVGLGGVGSACAEALCRCGVGSIIIVDYDTISITNINRQLIATHTTLGMKKADAVKRRLLDINPQCNVTVLDQFYDDEHKDLLFAHALNFVVDAIDTVTSKLSLAVECKLRAIPLVTCLGTGNRLDPTKFTIGNIGDTSGSGCGLARVMRRELKARGITELLVLYSTEAPQKMVYSDEFGRHAPASIAFCPPVAGYIIAAHVVGAILHGKTEISVN